MDLTRIYGRIKPKHCLEHKENMKVQIQKENSYTKAMQPIWLPMQPS